MEQAIIITDNQSNVNAVLKDGWLVKSVTAQLVATGGSFPVYGKFCFVLERNKKL